MAGRFLNDLSHEIRYAARMLRRHRAFTLAAVSMLALGIGATTAVFSVVNSVLINPLPYYAPDALARIVHAIGGRDLAYFDDALALAYADNKQAFEDVGFWTDGGRATVTGRGDAEEVRSWSASRNVLTVLGVDTEIGRSFSLEEDAPGAAGTVVLGYAYWQQRFGGASSALGQSMTINGRPHQIIGVMPPSFRFAGDVDVLLPLQIDRARPVRGFRLLGVARLKDGVSLADANADSGRILRIWLVNNGQKDPAIHARYQPGLKPLKQEVVGDVGRTLWILLSTIGIVLIMACANVANLLLMRAEGRRQEMAIRIALGAHWTRVARQMTVESITLALIGGVLGLLVAFAGLRVLIMLGPANLPRLSEIAIDPVVLAFALGVSIISGLFFGLAPVARHAGPTVLATAALWTRGTSLTRDRRRTQQALVALQVALALVLLVSAGLMVRSFQELRRVSPGFTNPQHLQTFAISIPPAAAAPDQVLRMRHEIVQRIAAIPGVASAAFTLRLPMDDPEGRYSAAIRAHDLPDDGQTPPNHQVKVISPGTFQAMGTPIVAGRDFDWTDLYESREVAIVSANLARQLWGSPDAALGKQICEYYSKEQVWRQIVGVADDVHDDGADVAPPATVYWPARQYAQLFGVPGFVARRMAFVVRTERAGEDALVHDLRQAVAAVNPSLPLAEVRTLAEIHDGSMGRMSFTLVMLSIAAGMALLLGVFGLYGVMAYAVSQRRREIGIRIALGAEAAAVRALVMRQGLAVAAAGIAIGLAGAAVATPVMRSLLFGVTPLDPLTFVAVPIVLGLAAMTAAYLPSRRAASVDPVESMRSE
jgi:putative ABC transport system permease protein